MFSPGVNMVAPGELRLGRVRVRGLDALGALPLKVSAGLPWPEERATFGMFDSNWNYVSGEKDAYTTV